MIALAKSGNEEAMAQVVKRFIPIVKKYSRQLRYEEACSDLVTWIVEAVHRYQPKTTWGKDELNRYLSRKGGDRAKEFRVIKPSEFITQEGLNSSATKMLPLRTTIIAITGATLGQVSLTEIETCANQSIIGVIGTPVLPNEFIYFWVKENISRLVACQTGGAQQHINKNNVNDMVVLCPDASVVAAYLRPVSPLFDRIKEGCLESRTLAALRDTLLPKLISGELRVPDAERIVGRCM